MYSDNRLPSVPARYGIFWGSDSSTRDGETARMRIYVGNLSFQATDADLQELFQQHGEVTSAQVIIDRYSMRSRGFGFVEMGSDEEAAAAVLPVAGSTLTRLALS